MASTTTAAPTAPGSGRLRQLSLTQRVLARPAAGALIIVIFVWIVFLVLSLARGNTAFLSLAGHTQLSRRRCPDRGHRHLRRAADDRGRVRPLDRVDGRVRRDHHGDRRDDLGPARLALDHPLDGPHDVPRRGQRVHRRPHGPAVVHRHAGDAVHHPRLLVGPDVQRHSDHLYPDRPDAGEERSARPDLRLQRPISNPDGSTTSVQVSILFWILIAIVGIYLLGRTRFGNWIAGVGGSRRQPATSASRSRGSRSRCSP